MKIPVYTNTSPMNNNVKSFWGTKSVNNVLVDIKRIKVLPVFISNK